MHSYSNQLSTIATISRLIISELFPACFSCHNNFNLLPNSSRSNGKNIVSETPEAMIAGDSSSFIIDLSLLLFCPYCLISNFISLPNSYINF